MNSDSHIPRILGAAFFIVAVASIFSEILFTSTLGSGSMSETLVNISNNLMQMRISILINVWESIAIIVLATLLFTVLRNQSKNIALVALGLYLAEATILAVSKTSAFSLISLSQEFVKAGAPDSSYFQALGILFLYNANAGYNTLLLFFSLGGLLFFYLFYKTKLIPRVLSIFGIIAASMVVIGSILGFFDIFELMLILPNMVFELTIGLWLMIKGIRPYDTESENG